MGCQLGCQGVSRKMAWQGECHLDQSILRVPEGRQPLKAMDKLGDVAANIHGGRCLGGGCLLATRQCRGRALE